MSSNGLKRNRDPDEGNFYFLTLSHSGTQKLQWRASFASLTWKHDLSNILPLSGYFALMHLFTKFKTTIKTMRNGPNNELFCRYIYIDIHGAYSDVLQDSLKITWAQLIENKMIFDRLQTEFPSMQNNHPHLKVWIYVNKVQALSGWLQQTDSSDVCRQFNKYYNERVWFLVVKSASISAIGDVADFMRKEWLQRNDTS